MTQCRICGAVIRDEQSLCVNCAVLRAHAQAQKMDPAARPGLEKSPAAACLACGERLAAGVMKCKKCATPRQDHARALKWNLKAARDGDRRAQERLGDMFLQGSGVARDPQKAMEWYLRSADQGNQTARAKLGAMYEQSQGVGQDFQKAIALYLEAADAGDALGQARLADMYYRGLGTAKDPEKAFDYFQASASKGNDHSQSRLGDMYLHGRGVRADLGQALKFYQQAAAQGNVHAQAQLGAMYLHGVSADRDFSQALEWNRRAAGQGSDVAQANLGRMFEKGLGVDKDLQQALDLYKKSAAQGNAVGQALLGDLYLTGSGVGKDLEQAGKCFQAAAEQGNDRAQLRLGTMYCQGQGVKTDLQKGFALLKKAAEQGNAQAQLQLGEMYRDGRGVAQDDRQAFAWFQKAAEQGHRLGEFNLGCLYESGKGVKRNLQQARRYYFQAAEKGLDTAQECLGRIYRGGLGLEENIAEAKKWYVKAAEQGNEKAKSALLSMDLEADPQKRFKGKLLASFQGDARAMAEVAAMYLQGVGTEMSEENALEWLKKSYDYGNTAVRDQLLQVQRSIAKRRAAALEPAAKKVAPPAAAAPIAPKIKPPAPPLKPPAKKVAPPAPSALPASRPRPARGPFSPLPMLVLAGLTLAIVLFSVMGRPVRRGGDGPALAREFLQPPRHNSELPVPPLPAAVHEMTWEAMVKKADRRQGGKAAPAMVEPAPAPIPAAPAAPLLRREYRTLAEEEIARMLAAHNMFDARRNPAGNLRHRYQMRRAAGLDLVADPAAKLVWMKPQNPVKMTLEKTREWIEKLNAVGYGGIRDWRLPTVEEAASLLRENAGNGKIFLDAVFGADIRSTWTGDGGPESTIWIVDFQDGTIDQAKNKSRLPALMVSSGEGDMAAD